MNEFEENIYNEIKNELVQSVIDKKIDAYYTNKNELMHYYNVGKMIVDAQGGDARARYGDGLIKKFSKRLTNELGSGYLERSLKLMRKFFIFQKGHALRAQLPWTHYRQLLSLKNGDEIDYYVNISIVQHLSYRKLQEKN